MPDSGHDTTREALDRRGFLGASARVLSAAGGFRAVAARGLLAGLGGSGLVGCGSTEEKGSTGSKNDGGYGPLRSAGPELRLPDGFQYRVLGVEGSTMSDGHRTPAAHDGMAAFPLPGGNIRLIRNHEVRGGPGGRTGEIATAYDALGGGGTTSLEVEPDGERALVRDFLSLNGTVGNCAGGPTPWGSWLSCEETTTGLAAGFDRPHGYVFDVAADVEETLIAAPLPALGRFVHEAVAVDPITGIVYETEDRSTSGFYRFIPDTPDDLTSGQLQMLAIEGEDRFDTRTGMTIGGTFSARWVDILDSDPSSAEVDSLAVFRQGHDAGGAVFARLEGCWYDSGAIYLTATTGGTAGLGQVWRFRPGVGAEADELTLIFESYDPAVLEHPDNITISPSGGVLLAEDGAPGQYLRGLTPDGSIFDFAYNAASNSEFAGVTFSPDGETLFVNIQGRPAITLAIWGPWGDGPL